jgi:predicted RNase H-like HicB family nuclease/predicted RNA binding protein YcfA (HicA-like mRNA interferase family)
MKARDVIAYAESRGWQFLRFGSRASHRIYRHPDYRYLVSIPDHGSREGSCAGDARDDLEANRWNLEASMNAYPIILERAEDGGWSAIAPDLPGLVLAADTREELLAEAPSAIADYLDALRDEHLPVPKPGEVDFVQVAV